MTMQPRGHTDAAKAAQSLESLGKLRLAEIAGYAARQMLRTITGPGESFPADAETETETEMAAMDGREVQIVILVPAGSPSPLYTVACSVPAKVSFARPEDGQIYAEAEAMDINQLAATGMASR